MTFLLTSLFWLIILIWQQKQYYQAGMRMGKLDMEIHYNIALSKLLLKVPSDVGYLNALEDLTDLITEKGSNV